MVLGRVVGAVWGTRKSEELQGCKLLLVAPWAPSGETAGPLRVCADLIGAGQGERVIVAGGAAARLALGKTSSPVDAAVVAIVDGWELSGG